MREEKQLLLDEIKSKIEDSQGFVVTSYENLTALRIREFRDKIAEAGGEFEVVRKRVFVKAAEQAGYTFDAKKFGGHVGIVFALKEPLQVLKSAVKYSEENEKTVMVVGGQIQGEKTSAEDLISMAKLPGIQELRAQLLGLFEAPMSQTLGTIQAVLTALLYGLEEKSKNQE